MYDAIVRDANRWRSNYCEILGAQKWQDVIEKLLEHVETRMSRDAILMRAQLRELR